MGVRIQWEGMGPPILFFPGWNTTAATVRSWLPETFKARFRCGVLEWPGLGAASEDPVPSCLEQLLDEVETVLPEGRLGVAGFCLGGVGAWAFARRHPRRVACTVLAETPQHFPAILAPLLIPGVGRLVLGVARGTSWGRKLVSRGILLDRCTYPEPFLDCLFDFPPGPSLAYLKIFFAFGNALRGPHEGLPPCWRLAGESALRVLQPALGRRHAVPSTTVQIEDAGHFPAVEMPERFFMELASLLSGPLSPPPIGCVPGR